MYGIGIDVSKGKSTVAVVAPGGEVIRRPYDVPHTRKSLSELASYIKGLGGDARAVLECTGHYHEPVLKALHKEDIFICAVNPCLIRNYDGDNSLRRVKSDRADAVKIAKYTIDKWHLLRQYSDMDKTREILKAMNTQYHFLTQRKVAVENNLDSLLDITYPGLKSSFSSPVREDGHQKWVDYAKRFWHVECVRKHSLKAFEELYKGFCRRGGYCFSAEKAKILHESAKEAMEIVLADPLYREMILAGIEELNLASSHIEKLRRDMDSLASSLPEYDTVMAMNGVGRALGPQLIAMIGDVNRFDRRSRLTAYAGVDPGVDQSGKKDNRSNPTSKSGSPHLRKALYLVMEALLKNSIEDAPVYRFMQKKKAEGKNYYVYMTAGANKFLRIYYARVKECMEAYEASKAGPSPKGAPTGESGSPSAAGNGADPPGGSEAACGSPAPAQTDGEASPESVREDAGTEIAPDPDAEGRAPCAPGEEDRYPS